MSETGRKELCGKGKGSLRPTGSNFFVNTMKVG